VTEVDLHRNVLIDTGPLVALRNRADSYHRRCVETLELIEPPLLTCWPVITEAAWMLRHNATLIRRLFQSIKDDAFAILEIQGAEIDAIDELFERYSDLSPQLADLALLHLAQRDGFDTVFTLDRRDFTVFRLKGNKRLRLLPEDY
jgi:uncharacterized protein